MDTRSQGGGIDSVVSVKNEFVSDDNEWDENEDDGDLYVTSFGSFNGGANDGAIGRVGADYSKKKESQMKIKMAHLRFLHMILRNLKICMQKTV